LTRRALVTWGAMFGGAGASAAIAMSTACGASSGGAARATDGGARDEDAGAEAGPVGAGVVQITEAVDGGGSFFAAFGETPAPSPTGCTSVDAGACITASCPASDAGAAPPDAATTVLAGTLGAGTLRVSGGVFGAGTGVDRDLAGVYQYLTPGSIFAPGDTLGVAATGGQVPAFARHSVIAPPLMRLTAPQPSGGMISVATSQPLTVAWTGGRAGDSAVLVATSLFTSRAVASMTCTWDAGLGTATIPSEALRPLAMANSLGSGISWYAVAQTAFVAGPVAVTLSAYETQGSPAAFQ
jgi:hypothetical protein